MSKALKRPIEPQSNYSRWYIVPEKTRNGDIVQRIKRCLKTGRKTSWERYPANLYKDLDLSEITALVARLNVSFELDRKASEDRYKFDHSYINIRSMAAFEKQLQKNISDKSKQGHVIHTLNTYVFDFFIIQNKAPDPSRWHLLENDWGVWLLQQDLSPSFLKMIVSTANRFNKFLTDKLYPDMLAPRKLEPIGKLKLEKMASNHIKSKSEKYIKPEIRTKIISSAKVRCPEILPNMLLAEAFGLRISETLGLTKDKFLKDSLLIDEQGSRIDEGRVVRKTTKTYERRVPYWNMSAKEAWALVKAIKPMHPDTLIKKVNEHLESFDHTSHDFRSTFITNALRKVHWKDVQKAVGHTDVRTTMGYDQDDRNLSEEKADLD